jgi:hypothetical protein
VGPVVGNNKSQRKVAEGPSHHGGGHTGWTIGRMPAWRGYRLLLGMKQLILFAQWTKPNQTFLQKRCWYWLQQSKHAQDLSRVDDQEPIFKMHKPNPSHAQNLKQQDFLRFYAPSKTIETQLGICPKKQAATPIAKNDTIIDEIL